MLQDPRSLRHRRVSDSQRQCHGSGYRKRPAHLDRGFFIEPTIFGNVDNNHTIAREEIFGPVLSVIPARDEADAVRIANDTVFGLNSSVFTNDPEKAYAVARQVRAGTVPIAGPGDTVRTR